MTAGLDRRPVYSNCQSDFDTQSPSKLNIRVTNAQENGNQYDKLVKQEQYCQILQLISFTFAFNQAHDEDVSWETQTC
jgi:hypothetical protein